MAGRKGHKTPPPSPKQIRRRARQIRKGWDTATRDRRRGAEEEHWSAPVFAVEYGPEGELILEEVGGVGQ